MIVALATSGVQAVRNTTISSPIVMAATGDPVGLCESAYVALIDHSSAKDRHIPVCSATGLRETSSSSMNVDDFFDGKEK